MKLQKYFLKISFSEKNFLYGVQVGILTEFLRNFRKIRSTSPMETNQSNNFLKNLFHELISTINFFY